MRSSTIFLSAVLLAAAAPVLAQNPPSDGDVTDTHRDADWLDNPRLGLLGLLGLGGLLGLMRREPSIHVDARGNRDEGMGG